MIEICYIMLNILPLSFFPEMPGLVPFIHRIRPLNKYNADSISGLWSAFSGNIRTVTKWVMLVIQ